MAAKPIHNRLTAKVILVTTLHDLSGHIRDMPAGYARQALFFERPSTV